MAVQPYQEVQGRLTADGLRRYRFHIKFNRHDVWEYRYADSEADAIARLKERQETIGRSWVGFASVVRVPHTLGQPEADGVVFLPRTHPVWEALRPYALQTAIEHRMQEPAIRCIMEVTLNEQIEWDRDAEDKGRGKMGEQPHLEMTEAQKQQFFEQGLRSARQTLADRQTNLTDAEKKAIIERARHKRLEQQQQDRGGVETHTGRVDDPEVFVEWTPPKNED